ncbi:MAG: asparagine synthase-related protein [Thermoleophilaceae bacterium]
MFLSGGLDSSLVAAIAAPWMRRHGKTLKTFAVGLEDSADLIAARVVAGFLDTEHHEKVYTAEEALEVLPTVVRTIESFDPSLVRSAVPNYLLSEMTSEHVKVVLTGEGADEIFAGYEYLGLGDPASQAELHDELVRTIEGLHNLNLQRADRVTMAHGLEGRVPFLELDMIELGLALPAGWKLAEEGQMEKRLLRKAFEGWLPDEFLWRGKEQFGDGSGALVGAHGGDGEERLRGGVRGGGRRAWSRPYAAERSWRTTGSSPSAWETWIPATPSGASLRRKALAASLPRDK